MAFGSDHADITGVVVRELSEGVKLRMFDNRSSVICEDEI